MDVRPTYDTIEGLRRSMKRMRMMTPQISIPELTAGTSADCSAPKGTHDGTTNVHLHWSTSTSVPLSDSDLDHNDEDDSTNSNSTRHFRKNVILAFRVQLLATGTGSLTREQYNRVRHLFSAYLGMPSANNQGQTSVKNPDYSVVGWKNQLPSSSTVYCTLKLNVLEEIIVRRSNIQVRVDKDVNAATFDEVDQDRVHYQKISIIPPSSYARWDTATRKIWVHFKSQSIEIDNSILRNRPTLDTSSRYMYVDSESTGTGFPLTASTGDTLEIALICDAIAFAADSNPSHSLFSASYVTCHSEIENIFLVLHSVRYSTVTGNYICSDAPGNIRSLSEIQTNYEFISYYEQPPSPYSDHSRHSRSIRREEDSSCGCIKPGDVVCVLCPSDFRRTNGRGFSNCNNSVSTDRLLFVHRMWTQLHERRRFIVALNNMWLHRSHLPLSHESMKSHLLSIFPTDSETRADTASAKLAQTSTQDTDREQSRVQRLFSSVGVLENGEPFFLYRFSIFKDGFAYMRDKPASAQGVYSVIHNFPSTMRNSKNACRVVSVAPPGASPYDVIRAMESDLHQGTTTSFLDLDADETEPRIFLD